MIENLSHKIQPELAIEFAQQELSPNDLHDLCDATDLAIESGGGFGWIKLPARDLLERYWQGTITMPRKDVFLARLNNVICGVCVFVHAAPHNEAQAHAGKLTSLFIAPWGRGYGLGHLLIQRVEKHAVKHGYTVINLDVRDTQEAAIKLYESEGYSRFATHPAYAYVEGHYVAGHYYMKILDAT